MVDHFLGQSCDLSKLYDGGRISYLQVRLNLVMLVF
jgi:hypothetical protein